MVVVAGILVLGFGGSLVFSGLQSSSRAASLAPPETSSRVIRVLGIRPRPGAEDVSFDASITVRLSAAPRTGMPSPRLSPPVSGTWTSLRGVLLVFHPSASYLPDTTYRLEIALASRTSSRSWSRRAGESPPAHSTVESSFTTEAGSTLRLEQLLAELGYLPVSFRPAGLGPGVSALASDPTMPSLVTAVPLTGRFAWRFDAPPELRSLWQPGGLTVITQGAVMAFESEHGLAVDGIAGPKVWAALVDAVAARDLTTTPYDYLLVTETLPETLDVWSNGNVVLRTLVNTGAPGAATPLGTWPVFLREASATMSGTNPNGTRYLDRGVPDVAYFYGSDAVHGFVRADYGFPQSNGCVELPLSVAPTTYGLDPLGTLVTVTYGRLGSGQP